MFGKIAIWFLLFAASASAFIPGRDGSVIPREDAKTQSTGYEYDALNRLTNVVYESSWKASFEYDPSGNVINHRAHGGTEVSFRYDEMNQMTGSVFRAFSRSFAVENSYDLNGNRTNIVYPGGLQVGYVYGADNRLESVTTEYTENTETISFGYDSASRMNAMSYPNGVNSTFGYDAESRITSIEHGSFVDRTIERNALGFKETECIDAGIQPTVPTTQRSIKTHNDADQLTFERVQTSVTNWTEIDYLYNDNGGLDTVMPANESSTAYTYDYDNRLESVGSMTSSTEYLYDASGTRIGRIAGDPPALSTNYFVVDYVDGLKRPLAETDAAGNITRYYVWSGAHLLCHIEANGTVRYYHSDELGSTLALTDETGAVTDEFAYMPYGYATHTAHTGSTETPFQWLGGYGVYYDSDTDLHLTLHRAYSSSMKRFISPDPLGIDGGVNVYMWANMNPLFFVDPKGLYNQAVDYWADMAVNTDNGLVRAGALTMGAIAGTYPDVITLDGRVAGAIGLGGEAGKGVIINLNDFTVAPYTTKGFAVGYQKTSPSLTTGLGWNIHQSSPANSDFQGEFHEVSASAAGKTGGAYWDSNWRGVSFGVTTKGAGATYQYLYYDVGNNFGQSSISQPNTSQSFSKPLK